MERPHWQYYLTLVDDLETLSRYVEIAPTNYSTYSVELVRILLAAGSEVDVVAKVLCQSVIEHSGSRNMDNYREVLMGAFPRIPLIEVSMPKFSLAFTPWADWAKGKNPSWWQAYNGVKHERHNRFVDANVCNALCAAAGLCVLVCYLYHDFFETKVIRKPLLFLDDKHVSGSHPLCGLLYRMPEFVSKKEQ
jgi:hypothetical protein